MSADLPCDQLGRAVTRCIVVAGSGAPLEGDLPELRAQASVPAAVLIAITDSAEPGVILTVRREHMRTHAGQIAFPGGRIDAGEDPIAAALREAHEELLLDPTSVEIVGTLDQLPDRHRLCGYAGHWRDPARPAAYAARR